MEPEIELPELDVGEIVRNRSRKKRRCLVSYEVLMWTAFLLFGAWAVVDRFVGPLMFNSPDGGFMPPPCFPNSHCLNFPALASNISLSVQVFDIYQRATGRLFVAVTPFLIILQCKTTENWFAEHKPGWLWVGDLRTTNNRIHYQMGLLFLTIPMYLHMWIFFVPLLAGVPFRFYHVGEEGPHDPLDPFVDRDGSMFMLPEDFLRLPLAILSFMILIPLSIGNYCRRRSFNVSHWLHIAAAAIYTMDYLRGNHPHAQMWTAPIVIYYLIDRLVGIFWYRTGTATIIHSRPVDDQYCVVFLYAPNQTRRRGIGSLYYYQLPGCKGAPRFAHPYTTWQNRQGKPLLTAWNDMDPSSPSHKFFVESSDTGQRLSRKISHYVSRKLDRTSTTLSSEDKVDRAKSDPYDGFRSRSSLEDVDLDDAEEAETPRGSFRKASSDQQQEESDEFDSMTTDTGDRVFFQAWDCAFIAQRHPENRGDKSFTEQLAGRNAGKKLKYWGPYYSDYYALNDFTMLPPVVLIATGAGANYIMDFYSQLCAEPDCYLANPVQVYFSTSSLGLFQFVTDFLCTHDTPNWAVTAHLTQHENELDYDEAEDQRQHKRQARLGRMSLEETILTAPDDAEVYFCGSPDIQWQIELLCTKRRLLFHMGNRFAASGRRECVCVDKRRLKCSCTKFPFMLDY